MNYYLLVYDRRDGSQLRFDEYPHQRRSEAIEERFREERNHRDDPEIEVVVLGSKSRESLMKTHSRYFKSLGDLAHS